ncbi:MAG: YtxH domain-containing protein [Chitinophagaceae bacterium]
MSDNQKFLGGLILGAAAGAVLALLANSEKGKEVIEKMKHAANDLGKDVQNTANDLDAELDALIAKGKAYIEQLEQRKSANSNS